jgi:hypothetical protein
VELAQPGRGHLAGQPGSLGDERLVLPRQIGLLLQRLQLAAKLGHDVLQPVHVDLEAGQLAVGPFAAPAVLGDPGRLLHHLAALFGAGGEDVLQLPLPHDGVQRPAHTRVGQELLDVEEPAGPARQSVLALPRSEHRPADLDLRRWHRDAARLVVDDQLDLGHPQTRTGRTPGEDHVGHLPATHCPRALFPQHPGDGVGYVRLAGSVGSDQHTDARSELERGALGEGLEPPDGERSKEHVDRMLPAAFRRIRRNVHRMRAWLVARMRRQRVIRNPRSPVGSSSRT